MNILKSKICSQCGLDDGSVDFKVGARKCNGCLTENRKRSQQKFIALNPDYGKKWESANRDLVKLKKKEWYSKNKQRMQDEYESNFANDPDFNKKKWSARKETSIRLRYYRVKYNAEQRGIEFNVDLSYFESLPMTCHYTGVELTIERNRDNTISYDRLDNSKGYVPGNIVTCCVNVNEMKRKMTKQELIEWCKKIVAHSEEKK